MLKNKDQNLNIKRKKILNDNNRWDLFKQRRALVVTKFIEAKRRMSSADHFKIFFMLLTIIKKFRENYDLKEEQIHIKHFVFITSLKVKYLAKRRIRRRGGISNAFKTNIRYCSSVFANLV